MPPSPIRKLVPYAEEAKKRAEALEKIRQGEIDTARVIQNG